MSASQWHHVMEPGFPISFCLPAGAALHMHNTGDQPVQISANHIKETGRNADFDECFLSELSPTNIVSGSCTDRQPFWPENLAAPQIWSINNDVAQPIILHAKQDVFAALNQPEESEPIYFRIVHLGSSSA
jgi:hypothetical protein